MEMRYDVFQLPAEGFPRWVTSASTLPEAKEKMGQLSKKLDEGQYLVRDFLSGLVVAYTLSPNGPGRRASDPGS